MAITHNVCTVWRITVIGNYIVMYRIKWYFTINYVMEYMNGAFNFNPPKPRYSRIWDVPLILTALRDMAPVVQLSSRDFTLKISFERP